IARDAMDRVEVRRRLAAEPEAPDGKHRVINPLNGPHRAGVVEWRHGQVENPGAPEFVRGDSPAVPVADPQTCQRITRLQCAGYVTQMGRAARGQQDLHRVEAIIKPPNLKPQASGPVTSGRA